MKRVLVGFALLSIALFLAPTAQAQTSSSMPDDISVYVGQDLPSGIDNVTDILPVFGGRYGIGVSTWGHLDLGVFNTHAYGVDFSTAELGFRGSQNLSPGVDGLFYAGLDYNYYKPAGQDNRNTDTGFHLGGGAMMALTDTLAARGDMKLMVGPGTSLILLFGIVFRTSGGTTN